MGLDVKKQDLKDAFKECKPADEASPVQASAEISDEQLEGVAGGNAPLLINPDELDGRKQLSARPRVDEPDMIIPDLDRARP